MRRLLASAERLWEKPRRNTRRETIPGISLELATKGPTAENAEIAMIYEAMGSVLRVLCTTNVTKRDFL
jgi:hypothetical protein